MKKTLSGIIAIFGVIGISASIITNIIDNPMTPILSGLRVFRFFTLQSNLIVVIYFSALFILNKRTTRVFDDWLGGVTIYISITFIVFAFFLQGDWHPTGLEFINNIFSHYIVPLSVICFLIYYRYDYQFKVSHLKLWVIYPLLYLVFVLIHGSITLDYIYPFFNIVNHGWLYFFIFSLGLIVLFVILLFGTVYLTKKKSVNH